MAEGLRTFDALQLAVALDLQRLSGYHGYRRNEATISTRTWNTECELFDNAVGELLSVPKEEARLKRQREKK